MVDLIIDDVEKALENDLYFAALITALTLPDICGKAEFPNEKTSKRYIDWFNENLDEIYTSYKYEDNDFPDLTGEIVYNLRCALFHQGNPNIDSRIKSIDKFALIKQRRNNFDVYADATYIIKNDKGETVEKEYRVSIRRLCLMISNYAKKYYLNNKDKFNFFNYSIEDWSSLD